MSQKRGLRAALDEGTDVRMRVVGIDDTTVLGRDEESTIAGRGAGERAVAFDERFKGWADGRVERRDDADGAEITVLALVDPEGGTPPEVAGEIVEWEAAEE